MTGSALPPPNELAVLADLAAGGIPFALIARDSTTIELLTGEVVDVDLLADIPLTDDAGAPQEVLALVPFRQVRERGFECHDDGAPLRCLIVRDRRLLDRDEALANLPAAPIPLVDAGFDIPDDEYAAIVRRVIADEIGLGEGANFVIRRDFTAGVDADAATAALTWFRALLEYERGAYWTFAIVTPGHVAVGASPEAHVSARDGIVTMNPISGTFRHPEGGATAETLTEFLESTKETEELFMVVDEELKMMSAVCSDGGRITGPHLKEMSRLTHTEYVLRGRSRLDPRDILRETMFAPTVTGSPMQNACTVITPARAHSARLLLGSRGPVHAAHGRDPAGRVDARPRCPDPHPHGVPRRRQTARPGWRDARAPLGSVRRGQRDAWQGGRRAGCDRRDPPRPPGRTDAAHPRRGRRRDRRGRADRRTAASR